LGARQYSDDKTTEERSQADAEKKQSEGEKTEITSDAELLEKLKTKEAESVDLKSRLQYLQADFLNLQRNAAREKEQQRDFAITRFAGDLLDTVDVLALALKSVPESALAQSDSASSDSSDSSSTSAQKSPLAYLKELHQGVEMTHRLLLSTLFKYHVKPFDPTGDKFDPNLHEALYQAPIPGKEPGTVLECQKTGYMIKDRLLRAAQVGVVQDPS
ncbi:GrpE nucleotide exchange factor, partial [Rhizopogon vinicolor AM-OR11-026]